MGVNMFASPFTSLFLAVLLEILAAVLLVSENGTPTRLAWGWSVAGASIAFLCYSFWRWGQWGADRRALRLLEDTVLEAEKAMFLTGIGGKVIIDNELCQNYFDSLKRNEVVSLTSLAAIENVLVADSVQDFARLKGGAEARLPDVGDLLVENDRAERAWWRLSSRPVDALRDYTLWTLEDVTAQKDYERQRDDETIFLADLLDQLPVGFFSADEMGNMRYLNKTLADWLGVAAGFSRAGAVGGKAGAGAEQIDPVRFADHVGQNAERYEIESDASGMHGALLLSDVSGNEFPAYLIQSQLMDDNEEFVYSRSVVLREPFTPVVDDGTGAPLLRRIPWLFSESPVGIVLLDLQGTVLDCNRAFLKLLGLHRDGVVGRPISERINKEDQSDADAHLSKVVMGIMAATLLEVRLPAGGERELTASFYISRIEGDDGEVTGLVLHVIDTTEQKNLEIQFNQAQKMQAVGQLAGGVAHDFNNLLTAMIGFCDLLLGRHPKDDPSFADIMQIKQNANRAANLVRQLLAFSRRQTLQPKIFSITDALDDISILLRRLLGENIELEMIHGPEVDLIRTDPGQFDQVIINLAVNARDAMPGGGAITVSTEKVRVETAVQRGIEVMPAGEYILIKVADTGSGIAKEDIGRIFEPFYSTKDVGEGTGLGLSTVYGIVRQSDGFVFVDSALGRGTTFSIYLPAFSAAEATAFGVEISEVGVTEDLGDADLTGAGTVLLVEDEDAVRVFGSRALRNKGYRVLEAEDGEHALDVINEYGDPIDLIITDVMMPGMDGHTLVSLVRSELPNIKIILMSGYAEEAIPGGIKDDGSINFLPKPFSLMELAGKVKEVLTAGG